MGNLLSNFLTNPPNNPPNNLPNNPPNNLPSQNGNYPFYYPTSYYQMHPPHLHPQPSQPSQPSHPSQPSQPSHPSQSSQPSHPSQPSQPSHDLFQQFFQNVDMGFNEYTTAFNQSVNNISTKNKKVPDEELNKLMSKLKSIKLTYDEVKENKSCSICLDDYKVGDTVYLLPCYHIFHKECLYDAFKSKLKCPYCRKEKPFKSDDGAKRRLEKGYEYKRNRLEYMKTHKIAELSNGDIIQRLKELGADTRNIIERKEAIEMLMDREINIGIRVE